MKVDTVQQYNDYFGVETLHPLVSVIEGSKGKTSTGSGKNCITSMLFY